MEPIPNSRARTARLVLVVAGVLALLAVVAFASRSGFGHASHARPTHSYVSWALSVFLMLFVLMIPVAIWAYSLQLRERQGERSSFQTRVLRGLAVILFFVLLRFVWMYVRHHLHFSSSSKHPLRILLPSLNTHGRPAHAQNNYAPTFQWPVLWATLGLIGAATVAYIVYLRRRKPPEFKPFPTESLEAALAGELTIAIDDLEREPDPRRAVIAAYARMEAVLGRHGLVRRRADTPLEFLRRALLDLRVPAEAVTSLTRLFERAKFSRGEVDEKMRADAIASLRSVRDSLETEAAAA